MRGINFQFGLVGFEVEFIGPFKSFFRALHEKTAFDQARSRKELVGLTGARGGIRNIGGPHLSDYASEEK